MHNHVYDLFTKSTNQQFLDMQNKYPYKTKCLSISEWLLFNVKWEILQIYHGENKLHSTIWWWCPLCTRPTKLVGLYSASSPKQQSASRHVAPFGHVIWFRANQSFPLLIMQYCVRQYLIWTRDNEILLYKQCHHYDIFVLEPHRKCAGSHQMR
jgi:hypothetical protein